MKNTKSASREQAKARTEKIDFTNEKTPPKTSTIKTYEQLLLNIDKLKEIAISISSTEIRLAERTRKIELAAARKTEREKNSANAKLHSIMKYAEQHWQELSPKEKKSIELLSVKITWQTNKPAVRLSKADSAVALQAKNLGLTEFYKEEPQLIKSALLKKKALAKKLQGVSFHKSQYFIIRVPSANIEFALRVKETTI